MRRSLNRRTVPRRALVTGAASGLAAGVAAALAADRYEHVAITYRRTDPAQTLRAIETAGAAGSAARVDFLDDDATVSAILANAVAENGPFDTLVHGVGPLIVKRFERFTLDDYREIFDGNVRSAVLAIRAVIDNMRSAGFGRIVLFAMLGSDRTQPFRGFTLYQAAKSAVVALARSLAVEEARHGITVNVVVPGDIRHKSLPRARAVEQPGRNPRGRLGSYEDVADAVRFFVARERDFITGAVLEVTGGLTQADERNEPAP
ncbi:MAG: SDR family oxidoreductase [Candidatus Eremiobacteraeota bacterium]|nr:SDR family oxidoreductase [Candidatus Eremiobacteraeota bacterium]MBV8373049.1 SDR family oxidoreductase [Candidatus Eremiobacteraeota bacterium]